MGQSLQVGQSLQRFGISKDTADILVASIHTGDPDVRHASLMSINAIQNALNQHMRLVQDVGQLSLPCSFMTAGLCSLADCQAPESSERRARRPQNPAHSNRYGNYKEGEDAAPALT